MSASLPSPRRAVSRFGWLTGRAHRNRQIARAERRGPATDRGRTPAPAYASHRASQRAVLSDNGAQFSCARSNLRHADGRNVRYANAQIQVCTKCPLGPERSVSWCRRSASIRRWSASFRTAICRLPMRRPLSQAEARHQLGLGRWQTRTHVRRGEALQGSGGCHHVVAAGATPGQAGYCRQARFRCLRGPYLECHRRYVANYIEVRIPLR